MTCSFLDMESSQVFQEDRISGQAFEEHRKGKEFQSKYDIAINSVVLTHRLCDGRRSCLMLMGKWSKTLKAKPQNLWFTLHDKDTLKRFRRCVLFSFRMKKEIKKQASQNREFGKLYSNLEEI